LSATISGGLDGGLLGVARVLELIDRFGQRVGQRLPRQSGKARQTAA
jgi:hypothetical protein